MKKLLKISSFLTLLILVGVSINFVGSEAVANAYFNTSTTRLVPIYSVQTNNCNVSISFDAAWGADKTEKIMDICDEYGIKATFFLVGFWMEKYPEITKQIANRGFEIGLHSNTHPDMAKLSTNDIVEQLTTNQEILYKLTGKKATLFRPPFGSYNNTLLTTCKTLNLTAIQWSIDSLDWKGLSAENLAKRVTNKVKSGDIILFHNNSDNILDGLKIVLEHFKSVGLNNLPIGELIYKDNYTINNLGIQIKEEL